MWRDILKDEGRSLASYIDTPGTRLNPSIFNIDNVAYSVGARELFGERNEKSLIITEEKGNEIVIAIYKGEILSEVVDDCKNFLKEFLETEIFNNLEQVQKGPIDKILDDTVRPIVARFVGRMLGVFFEDSTPIREGGILASGKLRVNNEVTVNTIVYGDYLQGLKDAVHDNAGTTVTYPGYIGNPSAVDIKNNLGELVHDSGARRTDSYRFRDKYGSSNRAYLRHSDWHSTLSLTSDEDYGGDAGSGEPLKIPRSQRVTNANNQTYVRIQKDNLNNMSNENLSNMIIKHMDATLGNLGRDHRPSKAMDVTRKFVQQILSEKNIAEHLGGNPVLARELFTYGGQMRDVPGKNPEDIMERLPEYTKRNLQIERESPGVENYKVLLGDQELLRTYFSLRFGIDRSKPIKIKGIRRSKPIAQVTHAGLRRKGPFTNTSLIYGARNPEGKEYLDVARFGYTHTKIHQPVEALKEILGMLTNTKEKSPRYDMPVDLVAHSSLESTIAQSKEEDGVSWEYSNINERHFVKIEHSIPYPSDSYLIEYFDQIFGGTNVDRVYDMIQDAMENDTMAVLKFKFYVDATGGRRVKYDRGSSEIEYEGFPDDTQTNYAGQAHYCIYDRIDRTIEEDRAGQVCIISYADNLGDSIVQFLMGQKNIFPVLKGNYRDGSVSISKDYITREDIEHIAMVPDDLKRPLKQLVDLIIWRGKRSRLKVIEE